ncbi:Hypothetical protein SRAE_1000268200 [Strongyloides ratti]|uniref:Uncharacterized protein n=1 Tax=Strongyloides ratti TaxID=34506 RepID=A0A090L8H0_STRRB|nr:Hypothetical protein SRAE_1000268200 [Strongyloides ratti]CEF64428.1 Hypothetical protein SRAE_1000268200 [Strongyloides ratti]
MLSKLATKESLMKKFFEINFKRYLASKVIGITGRPVSPKQLSVSPTESGYFKYERNISRNSKYSNPQLKGDTPFRFLISRLGHAYEVYPLLFLCSAWVCCFVFITWWSFQKIEVWIDRTQEEGPWAWERIKNNYWKQKKVLFDFDKKYSQRLEIMEALQDEMIEAAKKKGLR